MCYTLSMKEIFLDYKVNVNDEQLKLFDIYYKTLIEYNEKFNITAITEKEEVYKKHFLDSVINSQKLKSGKLIDVGSGGGFPALPIKIMNSDLHVSLLEATGKKCTFLKEVINRLGLSNTQVINNRAEELAKDLKYREQFDFCSARAVARLNTLLEYTLPFVKVGGKFIAFKGDATEEIKESSNALKVLGGEIEDVFEFDFYGAKRTIITIKKVKTTPIKYPRGRGLERKSPL